MKTLPIAMLLAAALAAPLAQADTDDHGPYLVVGAGRSHVNFDCGYYLDCRNADATAGKIVAGHRFRVFAAEVWYADFGRFDIADAWSGLRDMRVRAWGLGGAWYLHFGESWKGLMRAGGAMVRQTRSDDGGRSGWHPHFGLGLVRDITPAAAVELAWDISTSDGNNTSSSIINLVSAGLRLSF